MQYWGYEILPTDRLYLVSPNATVVVAIVHKEHPSKDHNVDLWRMGPAQTDGCSGVEDFCDFTLGCYNGHVEITEKIYAQLPLDYSHWIWSTDQVLEAFLMLLRSRWLPNVDIPEHENRLFSHLGFNEFHASKHVALTKTGKLPPLIE